jgi:hypothetical protein
MGRPPIGKVAMSGAERVRLYRLRHGADRPVTKPVTEPGAGNAGEVAALRQELAQARAELAKASARAQELEGERHARFGPKRHRTEKPPLPPDEARERTIKAQATQIRNAPSGAAPRIGKDGKKRRPPKPYPAPEPDAAADRANALSRQLFKAMRDFENAFKPWLQSGPSDDAKTLLIQTLQLSSEELLRLASDLY